MPLKKPITNKVSNDNLALGLLKVRQHRFKKPGFSFALVINISIACGVNISPPRDLKHYMVPKNYRHEKLYRYTA